MSISKYSLRDSSEQAVKHNQQTDYAFNLHFNRHCPACVLGSRAAPLVRREAMTVARSRQK